MSNTSSNTWEDSVIKALHVLGGEAHLSIIYDLVEQIRLESKSTLPVNFKAVVRRVVQQSKQTEPVGVSGSGVWRLVEEHEQPSA